MARSTRISRAFLLVFLVVIFVGTISLPTVRADEAVAVDESEEELLDMDEPVKEEEPVVVEEPEDEPIAVKEVAEEVVEEEEAPDAVEEPVVEEEEPIESTDAGEVAEESTSKKFAILDKLTIPFLNKLSKQDAKKIAAFSLGAWGAATGVGWAMQKIGGESD